MEALAVCLSAYWLTVALTRTDGPGGVLYRLRRITWLPLHCAACTAPYAALAAIGLAALPTLVPLYVFAVAGVVTLTEDIRQSLLK